MIQILNLKPKDVSLRQSFLLFSTFFLSSISIHDKNSIKHIMLQKKKNKKTVTKYFPITEPNRKLYINFRRRTLHKSGTKNTESSKLASISRWSAYDWSYDIEEEY